MALSVIRKSSEVQAAKRWDFAYHDPNYRALMRSLQNGYPVTNFGQIITLLTDMGAFSLYRTEYFVEEGIPFLRVQNVQEYGVDLAKDTKYITQAYHEQLKKSQLRPGDLLLTTKAVIGVACVVDHRLGSCNMSQNLVRVRLREDVNPNYAAVFLNSKFGRKQTETAATGPSQKYLNFERIAALQIPIPPRAVQDAVAETMSRAFEVRRAKLEQAQSKLYGMDDLVFQMLGISPGAVPENRTFLKSVKDVTGARFDVDFNMGFHKFDPYPNAIVAVDAVAGFPKQTDDPTRRPESTFKYIDIASIDTLIGEIAEASTLSGRDAPSRARQVVHSQDILISNVRPTRGAVAVVPADLDGQICSTGFTIVRAKHGALPAYLHIAFRLGTTLEQFGRRSSGSSYPAILESDIRNTLIPFPEGSIQDRIVQEVTSRQAEGRILRAEAEAAVAEAKAEAERLIVGHGAIPADQSV